MAGLPSGLDPAYPGAALRQEVKGLAQVLAESASRESGLVLWDRTAELALDRVAPKFVAMG